MHGANREFWQLNLAFSSARARVVININKSAPTLQKFIFFNYDKTGFCLFRIMLSNGARGCERKLSLNSANEERERERENFFTTLCGLVYSIGRQGAAAAHNEISCQTRLPVLSVTAITIQLPTQWHCHKLNPSAPRRTPCPPPVCSPSPRVASLLMPQRRRRRQQQLISHPYLAW